MDYIKVIDRKLKNVDAKICALFEEITTHDRIWVSDVVIQFLRTFVEHVNARIYADDHPEKEVIIGQMNIREYNHRVIECAQYRCLKVLMDSLNKSVSHYVPEGDGAERLMLMYYPYLLQVKRLMKDRFGMHLLHNIQKFPTDLDKTLDRYYAAISNELNTIKNDATEISNTRYYVLNSKPIVVNGDVFFETTLSLAQGRINKVDSFIVFSREEVSDNYAIQAAFISRRIRVDGFKMPIQFLMGYSAAIRPCELNKIAAMCGFIVKIRSDSKTYSAIMKQINLTGKTLLEEIVSEEARYLQWKIDVQLEMVPNLAESIEKLREIILLNRAGSNVVRYCLSYLRNEVIKDQLSFEKNDRLSNLFLLNDCMPFDEMPFATALRKHKVNQSHLYKCIDSDGREHEFLARQVSEAAEEKNELFLDINDENEDYYDDLIKQFNAKLYNSERQQQRKIKIYKQSLCIEHFVEQTQNIIMLLKNFACNGIANYGKDITEWINRHSEIDDETKVKILKKLYSNSKVGIIYGAAGTGKTKIVEYVAEFYNTKQILFLANTNSALENLRRRTEEQYAYETIYGYLQKKLYNIYDLIVIDECSMVSNKDIYKILIIKNYDQLLLVGDIYQIESIEFGNWFNFARYFLDRNSVNELITPHRAKDNKNLLDVWNAVRTYDEHMFLTMHNKGYTEELSDKIFEKEFEDEIVLCLGYNGIYGINNINRFMQECNPSEAVEWGVWTYKVGDKILFTESKRFEKVLYNNLKGIIVGIEKNEERIKFSIEVDKHIEESDLKAYDITIEMQKPSGNTVISFYVEKAKERDDDIDDLNEIVPFQIAYAVSIHKAQGLEFDSVKVVITKDVEERISHSIFYTAITRAKKQLKVYMSSETQAFLVERFIKDNTAMKQVCTFASYTSLKIKNRLSE